jgi:hypothetical protein
MNKIQEVTEQELSRLGKKHGVKVSFEDSVIVLSREGRSYSVCRLSNWRSRVSERIIWMNPNRSL